MLLMTVLRWKTVYIFVTISAERTLPTLKSSLEGIISSLLAPSPCGFWLACCSEIKNKELLATTVVLEGLGCAVQSYFIGLLFFWGDG